MNQSRSTIVTQGRMAIRKHQLEAARAGQQGLLVTTIEHLAARLAGGFSRPVETEELREAVHKSLPSLSLGELDGIKELPGMVTAATRTLRRAWLAGINLQARRNEHGRLAALADLELAVAEHLPAGMLAPPILQSTARGRLRHTPAITGPIEVRGIIDLQPVWRPLLLELAEHVTVTWVAPKGLVPHWLTSTAIKVMTTAPTSPAIHGTSAGTSFSEVIDAMRWVRQLLADGVDAGDIALAAASTDGYDHQLLAQQAAANIDIHFVHGIPVTSTRPGQAAAALADILVRGLSHTRMRRLNNHLSSNGAHFHTLPDGWISVLPRDAPMDRVADWERVVNQIRPDQWPDGTDHTPTLMRIVSLLQQGTGAAQLVGEELLPVDALKVWRKALADGPASAIDQTLASLRSTDTYEPTSSVAWMSAIALQAAPRPHVRLLGLNSSAWPRSGGEDALLPDHIVPTRETDPLPVARLDQLCFQAILATTATEVALSWARRGDENRQLARSSLVMTNISETRTHRHDIPMHAFSEADRLLARPDEFAETDQAIAAISAWKNWHKQELTAHDGMIRSDHPVLVNITSRVQSATSLRRLLRNPIAYVWQYGLGMTTPEVGRSGLQLDALQYGDLVHDIVEHTLGLLEASGGLLAASDSQIKDAVNEAAAAESELRLLTQPTPPRQLWLRYVEEARRALVATLTKREEHFGPGQSYAEVPFGSDSDELATGAPWSINQPVTIPGTDVRIHGYIDHMNISSDGQRVQVIDYKTGKKPSTKDGIEIDGGKELQRSLYAYAVRSLLGEEVVVESSLYYIQAQDALSLTDPEATLTLVSGAANSAIGSLRNGAAVPGIDVTDNSYDNLRFALPAYPDNYWRRKHNAVKGLVPELARLWEAS